MTNDSKILNSWGQPYNPTPVIKVDGKRPVTEEIAAAAADVYDFQAWLPVIENPDEVLRLEAGGDITLYDRIGRDPRVASGLRTRAKAVVGREWQLTPFSQEKIDLDIADYVTNVFHAFPYDRFRRSAVRGGVLKGYSFGEVMWDYSEGDTFIRNIHYRHQRRFKYAPDGTLRLIAIDNPYPGINASYDEATGIPLRKFQAFTFGDEVTTPYGNGLGAELYWPWFFKRAGIKSWMIASDKWGAPTAAGEYPAGTDKGKQAELLSAASSLHSNSAIVYPQGMNLRLIEAMRSGSIKDYRELCDFTNEEITISILGQLATTSGTPGKLGDSREQEAVYLDYIKDDADSLCEAQNDHRNGVIPWLVDYQFPGHGRYPKMWIKCEDEEDGKTLAERDKNLSDALEKSGLRLSKSYYVRVHGLKEDDIEEKEETPPEPEAGKAPLEPAAPAEPGAADEGKEAGAVELAEHPCPHCSGVDFAEGETATDPVGELAEQALDVADGSDIVAQIRKHIAAARDLHDARDTLVDLRKELDIEPVSDALAKAALLAHLTGRAEVLDEVAGGGLQFAESNPLPFDEAIQFFRQKLNVTSETWTDLWKGEHSRQFTVAGVMRDDMLEDFRAAIDEAIAEGTTHAAFLDSFDTIVAKYGWGYNGTRGWRSRVIYDTNIRTAYQAGRWAQLTDPDLLQVNPYLEYRHGDSVKPRPLHLSWNGTTLPAKDPWWKTHYTPNGWGCKCKVLSAGKRDLERAGKSGPDAAPDDGTYEWVDKKTGEIHVIPRGIDPGWDYNPGEQWLNPKTGKREKL